MFEVDAWLNGHNARLTKLEVLGLNSSCAPFFFAVILFGKLFLISGPFCSTFFAHIFDLCRAMQEWVHYISFEAGLSLGMSL